MKPKLDIKSWKDLHKLTDALKKITDDPEGGTVRLKTPEGKDYITFTMPPKKDRHPLGLPKLKEDL